MADFSWAKALTSKATTTAREVDMSVYSAEAEALYSAGQSSRPSWDQLGDETRSVWRLFAKRKAEGDPEWWSVKKPAC